MGIPPETGKNKRGLLRKLSDIANYDPIIFDNLRRIATLKKKYQKKINSWIKHFQNQDYKISL